MMHLLLHTLLLGILHHNALAYPTGTGGCDGVQGSVGAPHLNATTIITGSIEQFGATVYFGAVDTLTVGQVTNFTINEAHTMVVSSTKTFRGLLFRLTSDGDPTFDPRGALTVSPDLPILEQISQVCFDIGIAGVTQLNNTDITSTEAVVNTNQVVQGLTLEITLVVSNRIINGVFVSEYYWSSYQLNSYDPSATASPTNFRFPTTSPSVSMQPSPQPKPVSKPTPQPTLSLAATFPPTFPPVTSIPTVSSSPTITAQPTGPAVTTKAASAATSAAHVTMSIAAAVLAFIGANM
jgi:hypothetical protein